MPAHPFRVRAADLMREPGSRRDVDVTAPLADAPLETSAAATTGPATVTGHIEGMAGGVCVAVQVVIGWEGACRRCLEPVRDHLVLDVREIAQPDPVDDEVYELDGDVLDLEPIIREVVLAGLPLAPLCADDCAGPAPDQVVPSIGDPPPPDDADGDEPPRDPRWAALDDLDL